MAKEPRIKIPPEVRQYVLDRDGYRCQTCGADSDLTIDHIIPLAQGGQNDLSNFRTLCRICNSRKGKAINPDARRYYRL
ncbi:MAG: HNH endonuclease [Cyanobacteria bacterium]|nr:HNH endonuclease [Cyanobacteriota bacterium]MDW8201623.1 HNH endonuclease [Cyanobacteriota bacterium SKYGB_h_bin112]